MTEPLPRVERDDEGNPIWVHSCSGHDPEFQPVRVILPVGDAGWRWTADGGLTPSVHCHGCGVHGHWVGGDIPAWRSC